ncbi:vesicle-associated membrane protein 7 [Vigna unguiculata]|uniref:Vesicle-associated membrane protein 7 n=1 Tax=Vigna unguiculata TaxID=3917 RepID=A0A4D6LDT8_VIGUN|nr:vesicle-associated membrane protein 7 [Vigna unguiculata]
MVDNIEKILERGDRIELLVYKTATMQDSAFHFRKQSKRLRRALWMKNFKLLFSCHRDSAYPHCAILCYLPSPDEPLQNPFALPVTTQPTTATTTNAPCALTHYPKRLLTRLLTPNRTLRFCHVSKVSGNSIKPASGPLAPFNDPDPSKAAITLTPRLCSLQITQQNHCSNNTSSKQRIAAFLPGSAHTPPGETVPDRLAVPANRQAPETSQRHCFTATAWRSTYCRQAPLSTALSHVKPIAWR